MTVQEWLGKDNKIGMDIWDKKYRFKNEDFDSWLDRVSNNNADVKQLIIDKKFLFGGRILSNRGLQKLGKKVTYSNCYVISPPEDNIESIFDTASKLARTFSYGGGCGVDISKLSPKGAKINNAAKETTGAVSFMELYSLTTELIGQNGRRGALMISLDCTHPDVLDFANIKMDLNKVTKANISIKLTDDFMRTVKNDGDWNLIYNRKETGETILKTVKTRELFSLICKNNWTMAEPGALYWDRIKSWNLLSEDKNFEYAGVNP
jgi:ribonucleoside-diphosphate reductase alpha chain